MRSYVGNTKKKPSPDIASFFVSLYVKLYWKVMHASSHNATAIIISEKETAILKS